MAVIQFSLHFLEFKYYVEWICQSNMAFVCFKNIPRVLSECLWRGSFIVIGGVGFVFGIIGLSFIKEPKRGRFDVNVGDKPKQTGKGLVQKYLIAFTEIFKNKCSRWIIIAGCLRFWAGNANDFSYLNALALLLGGIISNLITGYLSDKYDDKNSMAKTYLCIFGTLMAIPTTLGVFLITSNFYVAMSFLFLKYSLSEGWISPSISMIQTVIDSSVKGVAISVFLFTTTISGTIATVVIDQLIDAFDAYNHLERLGYIMVANCCIPYITAIPCFYIAGKNYEEFKKCLHYCKSTTLERIKLEEFKNYQVINRENQKVMVKRSRIGKDELYKVPEQAEYESNLLIEDQQEQS
ncbi:UNKNOWN [Stylonychia lemnae]|uniref:Uncharacterized protein n=1 Tax=Stylonychia lemnae TaxID=5949 RepID=A0A078BCD0_STYLE|nr:UNKNOWN [Stylonychia lemnae]|eukprot:CDW91861.1 UNKNOWN [Stylonychia lemnae]